MTSVVKGTGTLDDGESEPSNSVGIWGDPLWKTIVETEELPEVFTLHDNYPNPFNPSSTIKYDLPEESFVELRIFDLIGREIRTLINGNETAGFKSAIWNGKDNRGNSVSTGVYIYRLAAKSLESEKEFHQTRKMVLIR